MIIIWGVVINTTVARVIEDLRPHTNLMKKVRDTGNDLMVTCISHGGGQERNPSMGILKQDEERDGRVYPAGTVNCFTCGYKADLPKLVADVLGIGRFDAFKWLIERYLYSVDGERVIEIDIERKQEKETYFNPIIADSFHKQYLESTEARAYLENVRNINEEVVKMFKVGFSPENNTIVFPIFNRQGKLVTFKDRALESKFYQNQKNSLKGFEVFGITHIKGKKRVWVVEGEIDCMTLWGWGIPAVAIMGSKITDRQVKEIIYAGVSEVVLAFDNDEAGKEGVKLAIDKFRGKGVKLYLTKYDIDKKDFNDMEKQEFIDNVSVF